MSAKNRGKVESSREERSGQEGAQAGQDAGKLTGQRGAPSDFRKAHRLVGASRGSHSGGAQFGCLTTRRSKAVSKW